MGGSGILPEVYNYSFIYCSGSAEGIPLGKSARRLSNDKLIRVFRYFIEEGSAKGIPTEKSRGRLRNFTRSL